MTHTRHPRADGQRRPARLGRRRNPRGDERWREEAICAAVRGHGRPRRASLAAALEAVTDVAWGGRLAPGHRLEFTDKSVVVVSPDGRTTARAKLKLRSPPEALEAAASRGLVPMEWVGDVGDRFVLRERLGRDVAWVGLGRPAGEFPVRYYHGTRIAPGYMFESEPEPGRYVLFKPGYSSHGKYVPVFGPQPPSVAVVVALASDAERLPTMELLARDAVSRLRRWMVGEAASLEARVAWGFEGDDYTGSWLPPQYETGAVATAQSSCSMAATEEEEACAEAESIRLTPGQDGERVRWVAKASLLWGALSDRGARVSDAMGFRSVPTGTLSMTYDELPDPFAPILSLWSMGYCASDTVGPNLTVAVPPLSVPGHARRA